MRSSELNEQYLPIYAAVKQLSSDYVTGYKLVLDTKENYYSVLTGLFRYKLGFVSKFSEYSELYNKKGLHNPIMVGKIAIFKNIEDIPKLLPGLCEEQQNCIIKIYLSTDLYQVTATNNFAENIPMYIGRCIEKIERTDGKT
jgi:hypothetical protein